jgi:peptide deformylase
MPTLPILQIGHPDLRVVAEPVPETRIHEPRWQRLIDDLVETMRVANGAGLAATQVGVATRIVALEVKDNPRYPYKPPIPLTVAINPELTPIGDERFENWEGCLSVPDLRGPVMRHRVLRVRYLDRDGQRHEQVVHGLTAGTWQHECDHLDGLLFVDRVADSRRLSTWENWARFDREGFLATLPTVLRPPET